MRARHLPLCCFVAAAAIVNNATARAAEPLSLDAIFAEEGHARAPSEIAWTEDGSRVSFLWSKAGKRDLWSMAPETDREPAVLVRAGELEDGEREITLKDYVWSPDGKALLFQVAGDLYHYRLADRALRRLTTESTKNEDPRFSPDSSTVAFVRDADLWLGRRRQRQGATADAGRRRGQDPQRQARLGVLGGDLVAALDRVLVVARQQEDRLPALRRGRRPHLPAAARQGDRRHRRARSPIRRRATATRPSASACSI